jgi:hypothetical protein
MLSFSIIYEKFNGRVFLDDPLTGYELIDDRKNPLDQPYVSPVSLKGFYQSFKSAIKNPQNKPSPKESKQETDELPNPDSNSQSYSDDVFTPIA